MMLDRDGGVERVWLDDGDCGLADLRAAIDRETRREDYPHAAELAANVPVYDGAALDRHFTDEATARPVMAEINRAFRSGPGIVVIRGGNGDIGLLDAVTGVLEAIIADEAAAGTGRGDHFAAAGANSRVWNAHEKLCLRDPELFARYNASEIVRRVSEAWLGPCYQITTQVNVVRPGGKAQAPHRDYHLGFQDAAALRDFPAVQHALSAALTLQGAIAHSDMPVASGPTKLLPYSQTWLPGYLAVLRDDIRAEFEARHVQLPLAKGDMLFFNPATFHAAGENRTTGVQRFANLMQIGSAFGRSIEIVDRGRITRAVYPHLGRLAASGALTPRQADNVVAATAEGYPFPANLDRDSPLTGMAPPSQQDILRTALAEGWTEAALAEAITAQEQRRRSH